MTASTDLPGAALAATQVQWLQREPPLPPVAALGVGRAALALARRVLDADEIDREPKPWHGVAGPETDADGSPVLALLGDELPWAPGVVFFGADAAAPSLLLPTRLQPSVAVGLLQRVVLHRQLTAPVMVVPPRLCAEGGEMLISMAAARFLDRGQLGARLAAWSEGGGRKPS